VTVNGIPLDLLNGVGVVSVCVLAVIAFTRGWVCSGRELRDAQAQRDEWQAIALRSLQVSERTTGASEVAASALAAIPDALEGRPS